MKEARDKYFERRRSDAVKHDILKREKNDQNHDFGYTPSGEEPYMNSSQIEYFRQKLLDWRNKLIEASFDTVSQLKNSIDRETDFLDKSSFETTTTLLLRNRDRDRKLIRKIDEALERIRNGTYGYCEETGEEIGLKRLEARPIATLCLEAQEWHERGGRKSHH
jgi:DnaK suppressor protein